MLAESLDKTLSVVALISSVSLAWWGHTRTLNKERRRAREEEKQKHTDSQLKAYAAERDFGHIQRDIEQLKVNVLTLSSENDERLDQLERQLAEIFGALNVLKELAKHENSD